jgi:hypothetical protein
VNRISVRGIALSTVVLGSATLVTSAAGGTFESTAALGDVAPVGAIASFSAVPAVNLFGPTHQTSDSVAVHRANLSGLAKVRALGLAAQARRNSAAVALRERQALARRAAAAKKLAAAKASYTYQPGSMRALGLQLASARGWGGSQFVCLDKMWTRESNWGVDSDNSGSGAYGIPQATPGSKMARMGADWRTNPVVQIRWGLAYIAETYGTPCSAWDFWQRHDWY